MKQDTVYEDIIKNIAETLKMDVATVDRIVQYQFERTAKVIASSEPVVVKLDYLGKFYTSQAWIDKVQEKIALRNAKLNNPS